MSEIIYKICGDEGRLSDLKSITNDPNYVFENDLNYDTIVLMNEQGNVINVNSWIECANYVNGGWFSDKIDLVNGEKYVFFGVLMCLFVYFSYSFLQKRRLKSNSKL
jgi:hypothetical protein